MVRRRHAYTQAVASAREMCVRHSASQTAEKAAGVCRNVAAFFSLLVTHMRHESGSDVVRIGEVVAAEIEL